MEKTPQWFRIAQLEELSGISRRTIHFYLKEGLLSPPRKTGKTMAYYHAGHLQELAAIAADREQGLPLFAIREKMKGAGRPRSQAKQGGPRSAQGEKTREALLDEGCRMFKEKGYKAFNVTDVTKHLGVGKGTFYFYFTDKKALFLECAPRIFADLFSEGWEHIARENNPLERLRLRGKATAPVLKQFCSMLSLAREAMEDPDEKIRKLGQGIYSSIRGPVESDLKSGIKKGIFREVDPSLFAGMIIGGMEGLNETLDADGRNLSPDTIADAVFQWLALGVQKRPGE